VQLGNRARVRDGAAPAGSWLGIASVGVVLQGAREVREVGAGHPGARRY
jgi:hypothetical protein